MNKLKENFLFAFIFVALFTIMLACGETPEVVEKEIAEQPTDIKISANRLFKEYEANQVAADEKYKDKILEISGIVDDIGKDIADQIYVALKVGGEYEISVVQCYFSGEHTSEAAQLKKGQKITIKGKCEEQNIVGNIIINGCVIVK